MTLSVCCVSRCRSRRCRSFPLRPRLRELGTSGDAVVRVADARAETVAAKVVARATVVVIGALEAAVVLAATVADTTAVVAMRVVLAAA